MKKNNVENTNKTVILGVGGGANYYIAQFFNFLGAEVIGFDINKNERTEKLEEEGVQVNYHNPKNPFDKDVDLIIYSNALPDSLIEKIKFDNLEIVSRPFSSSRGEERAERSREPTSLQKDYHVALLSGMTKGSFESRLVEAGAFNNYLTNQFEKGKLTKKEKEAFNKASIAPLFNLDTSKVKIIGVTGTDGKTTTAAMLGGTLKQKGKTGIVTTIGAKINDKEIDTGLHVTTPSNQNLFKVIKKMIKEKCEYIVLEITSQGLVTGRVAGLNFDTAVVTNVTKEHLDYHKNFKEYIKAKSLLFSKYLKKEGTSVLNYDDKKSYDFLKNLAKNKIIYSKENNKSFFKEKGEKVYAEDINAQDDGIRFTLNIDPVGYRHACTLPITGEFNVSNALAAGGAAFSLGLKPEDIKEGLNNTKQPAGRMHVLQTKPFKVIVDFAHTEGSLENLLKEISKNKPKKKSKVILVFGCAGKRDPSKRKPMGKLAGKYADITILTAEDPRTESLKEINDEIEKGWKETSNKNRKLIRYDDDSLKEHVRRRAIARALREAHHEDIVLITGKGHENSLCFETTEYEWNDIKEVKNLLRKNVKK